MGPPVRSEVDGSMRKIVGVISLASGDGEFLDLLKTNPLKALSARDIDLSLDEQKLLLFVLDGSGESRIADISQQIDGSWLPRLIDLKDRVMR
jgi:hypothetical protein